MPATPRKDTTATTATAPVTTEPPSGAVMTEQPTSTPPPAAEVVPTPEPAGAQSPAAEPTGQAGSALVDLVTFPVRASQVLVHDVAVTARHPEAVAYWTGLAALAVMGALEWPVAAAAGIGVVVAGAVRRGHA